jgi:hypothetical protein
MRASCRSGLPDRRRLTSVRLLAGSWQRSRFQDLERANCLIAFQRLGRRVVGTIMMAFPSLPLRLSRKLNAIGAEAPRRAVL